MDLSILNSTFCRKLIRSQGWVQLEWNQATTLQYYNAPSKSLGLKLGASTSGSTGLQRSYQGTTQSSATCQQAYRTVPVRRLPGTEPQDKSGTISSVQRLIMQEMTIRGGCINGMKRCLQHPDDKMVKVPYK